MLGWSSTCLANCLRAAVPAPKSDHEPEEFPDLSPEYLDLKQVFSKAQATSLPLH